MSYALAFWVIMLIWLVFGFYNGYRAGNTGWPLIGGTILQFILFVLLGLEVFGAALHH